MTNEISMVTCWVWCVYMHHRDWVAWQTRLARLYVRSDVSICTNLEIWTWRMKLRWWDRRVQHSCLLNRVCQYAPIWKYKLLRNRLAMCELLGYENDIGIVLWTILRLRIVVEIVLWVLVELWIISRLWNVLGLWIVLGLQNRLRLWIMLRLWL